MIKKALLTVFSIYVSSILLPFPLAGEDKSFENNPYMQIPVIDAYYKGNKLWFIHTDVSDPKMAHRLTKMVDHRTLHAARLGAVLPEKVGKIYVFTNGVSQKGVKPWGGGPFGYQIDIFNSIPGDPDYTPLRNPRLVTWKENAKPRILKSEEEVLEAEKKGELTIKKTDVIVNAPIVAWPSDYLRGSAKLRK